MVCQGAALPNLSACRVVLCRWNDGEEKDRNSFIQEQEGVVMSSTAQLNANKQQVSPEVELFLTKNLMNYGSHLDCNFSPPISNLLGLLLATLPCVL